MRMRSNKRGALEGLPLYLIILVVIAAVATAAVLGWMKTIQKAELGSIAVHKVDMNTGDEDPVSELKAGTKVKLRIYAYDTNGNPLEGAVVLVQGCGIDKKLTTGKSGYATLTITPELPPNTNHGEIKVVVSYTGKVYNEIQKTLVVNA